MGKGKCCEYVLWSGILCVKGVYACPAKLVSGIRIGQPEKLGKCLNLKWQAKTSDTLDKYLKMIPAAGMMQTGEIFSKSWYFNICTLQPLDSKERFSKIQDYLSKTDAISVVKSGEDILLIMGDTKLTQCLGVNQNSQYLHCVVLSKQSKLTCGKSKPAESPRQTELPLLETHPTSSVLTIGYLKETLNSSHKQTDHVTFHNHTNKTDEMTDGHTKCQKGVHEDRRVAESSQAHPERKRHKSEHCPSVVSLDKVTGSCGETKAQHRKRHKSETPQKNDSKVLSVSGNTFKKPAEKSCLESGCADNKNDNKTNNTMHCNTQGQKRLKTLTEDQCGNSSRDSTVKRSKTTVTKLSTLEQKQMESEKVFSQLNMSHSKVDVQSLGRIPKKKSTEQSHKESSETDNEMNAEKRKSPKEKSKHSKSSSTKKKMNERSMDLDKWKGKGKKGKTSNDKTKEAIDKDTPNKFVSTIETTDHHNKVKKIQEDLHSKKESSMSATKKMLSKESKHPPNKKDVLQENQHNKKENLSIPKKMVSTKESKDPNSKKELFQEDLHNKKDSLSSSKKMGSPKVSKDPNSKKEVFQEGLHYKKENLSTPKKMVSTKVSKDLNSKKEVLQEYSHNKKESLSSSKKRVSTKESKDLNSKKEVLQEDLHNKKESLSSSKKRVSTKESKDPNCMKEVLQKDSHNQKGSISSSKKIGSTKVSKDPNSKKEVLQEDSHNKKESISKKMVSTREMKDSHYKEDRLDVSDKQHTNLPCIDLTIETKRDDPETESVTSSHEEDLIHYAHEPELSYERDTTDDLFILEQSSKGDTGLSGLLNDNVSFRESIKRRSVISPCRNQFPSLQKLEQVKCREFKDNRGKVTRNTRKTDDDISVVIPNANVGLDTHSKVTSMDEFIMHSMHGSSDADTVSRLEVCSLCVAVFESLTSKDLFKNSRKMKVDQSNLYNLKITIQFAHSSDNKKCSIPNDQDSQIKTTGINEETTDPIPCKEGQIQKTEPSEASSLPMKLKNLSPDSQCIKSNTVGKEEEENVEAITSHPDQDNQSISKWTDNERKQTRDVKQTDSETKQIRDVKQTDNETKQRRDVKQTDSETKQIREVKQTDNETKQRRDLKQTDNETKQERDVKLTDSETKQRRDVKQTDSETKQRRDVKQTDSETKEARNEKQTDSEKKEARNKSPDLVWNQSLIRKLRTEGSKSSEKLSQNSSTNQASDKRKKSTSEPNHERQNGREKVSSGCESQSNNATKLSRDRSPDLVWNHSLIKKLRTEGSKSSEKLAQNSSNNRAVNKSKKTIANGKKQDGQEKVSSGCELGHGRSITPKQESLTNRLQKITNMAVPKEEKKKTEKSVKNEKRQARQFHPYKKEFKPEQSDKPTWSFDIAYSDMEELLQNLTENMFLVDSRVPADVRRWRKGTSRSSVGHVRGRFCGHRFTRSEVPKCLPSSIESRESDDDYVIDPDLISNMEERARQADMVEEKWQTKTEEETSFIEEMCIYNQDKDEVTSTDSSAHVKTVKSTTTLIIPGMGKTATYSAEQLGDMDSSSEELFQDNNLQREQPPVACNVSYKEEITAVVCSYSQPVSKSHNTCTKNASSTTSECVENNHASSKETVSVDNDDSSFNRILHTKNNNSSSKSTTSAKNGNTLFNNSVCAKSDHVSTKNGECTKNDNALSEDGAFAQIENAASKNSECSKNGNVAFSYSVCAKNDIPPPKSAKNDIAPSNDSSCDKNDIASCTNTVSESLYTGPEKGYVLSENSFPQNIDNFQCGTKDIVVKNVSKGTGDISKLGSNFVSQKGNIVNEKQGQENNYVQSNIMLGNLTEDQTEGLTSIKAPILTQRSLDQKKEEIEKVTKELKKDIHEEKQCVNCSATTECVNETNFKENNLSKTQLQTPQTPGLFCMSGLQDKSILSSDSDVCLDWSDDEVLSERGQEESSHDDDDDDDDKTFIVIDTLVEQDSDPTNIVVCNTRLTDQQSVLGETELDVKESSLIEKDVKARSMQMTDSMCDKLNSFSEVIERKKLKAADHDKGKTQAATLLDCEINEQPFNISQEMGIKGGNLQSLAETIYGKTNTSVSKTVSFKESLCEKDTIDNSLLVESVSNGEYAIHQNTGFDRTSEKKAKVDERNTQKEHNEHAQIIKDEHGNIDNLNRIIKLENDYVDELYGGKNSIDFENVGQNTQQSAANYTTSSEDVIKSENSDFQAEDRDCKSFLTTLTSMKKDPDVLSASGDDSSSTRTTTGQTLLRDTNLKEIREPLQPSNTPVSTLIVEEHLEKRAGPHKNINYTTKCITRTEVEQGDRCKKLNETEDKIFIDEIQKIKTDIKTEKDSFFDSNSLCTGKPATIKPSSNPCTIESSSSQMSSFPCTSKPTTNRPISIPCTSKPAANKTNANPGTVESSTSKTNSISSSSKLVANKTNTISPTSQISTTKPSTIPCPINSSTNSNNLNKPRCTVGPVESPQVSPITHQTFVPHQSYDSPPWLKTTPRPLLNSQYDMFGSPYQQFNLPYNHLTPNNLVHYPNVPHVSPDIQRPYSNMTQFSPNSQQHFQNMTQYSPNIQRHYPNMSQFSPDTQQHFQNMTQFSPNTQRHYSNMTLFSPNSQHHYLNRYDPHVLNYQQGHWNFNEPYHAQRSYQTMTSYSPQQPPQNGPIQSNATNKQLEESQSSNAFWKK